MLRLYFFLLFLLTIGSIHAQDFKFGKVSVAEVVEKVHPQYPEANAAVLFREHNTYYEINKHTGIMLVTKVHERIKIYNKEGVDWAEKVISTYHSDSDHEKVSSTKGITYNLENGKLIKDKLRNNGIFEEKVNEYNGKVTLNMPAVTEGSVIEYEYSLRSPFLTSIDDIPLQYTIPINHLEVKITIPEFFGFQKHFNTRSQLDFQINESRKKFTYNFTQSQRSGVRAVKTSFQNNKVEYLENIYEISETDIPPLKDEVYVDYLQNYAAFLTWELQYTKFPNSPIENFSQTWEGVAKTIFDNGLEKEINRTGYFKNDLKKLLKGINNPEDKISKIYNFVREKVKWNKLAGYVSDNGAKVAYKEGAGNTGDINLMLVAMLKHAGINASPVLLSTQDNGVPLFPTRSGFNYVIAGIELPDDIILLDATDHNAFLNELPKRARNWQGRLIRQRGSSAWVDLMPKKQAVQSKSINIQFKDNMKVEGKSISNYSGLFAKSYRENFAGLNRDNYIQLLEEDKGNIVISGLDIKNKKSIGEDIRQTYEFELADVVENINDKIYFQPMVFEAIKENPFKAKKRHYPIFLDFPSVTNKRINIMIPEGYKVESLPENTIVEFKNGKGEFKFITTVNGNFLRVDSVLNLNEIVFSPLEYNNLKNFYEQMLNKHSEAIVLTKAR